MSISTIILTALALIPAAGLMFYVYKMDRVEKEPAGLLVGLFFLGVGSVVPAIILELLLHSCLNAVFFGVFSAGDPYFYSEVTKFFYNLIYAFVVVALVEEGCKFFFMFILTHKNKNFNCLFDGVVYSVFVSLGFAAAENIIYVFQNGVGNALMRMVTAVPAHCFFGVIMGYFYSKWFLTHQAGQLERHLRQNGIIPAGAPGFPSGGLLALSLFAPVIGHGFYDFCAFMDSWVYIVLFVLFLGLLYFICFRNVSKLSKKDSRNSYLSMDMVLKKYPQATAYVSTIPEYAQYFYYPQPVSYAQPVQPVQPFAQPVQPTQPFTQPTQGTQPPFAQPVQPVQPYAQPAQPTQPFAQPTRGTQPPFAQPVQTGQPPYAQPVQNHQPYVQRVQNPNQVDPSNNGTN
ncbi:MAG: PrsW family intramembrane metalloprotease [Ruminococcus sp.]|nr:PrsW family intramembrane metalloprotease [Ruminococcus sp.]